MAIEATARGGDDGGITEHARRLIVISRVMR
jgi:hypothetical protein